MKKQWISVVCSAILILLFSYNSLDKLMAGKAFWHELNNQPLPKTWTPFLHYGIPTVELLIVASLLFRRTDRWGFLASLIWLAIFSLYIGAVLLNFFTYIPCSCAGVIKGMSWRWHLVFNLVFMAIALTGLLAHRSDPQRIPPK